ncbi:hypothetical protein QBC43DRAFT_320732 [Cladorrhinum sp. PSN259]|nr:hypothetical protein QBC43DRAFT_320732 [Cladorrhinum sp. PSN259]
MPSFLKPAVSARHRQACLALYKTLHQTAAKITLPDDILAAYSSIAHSPPEGSTNSRPENPIRALIRNAFRRNRRDTSSRLVVSALKNGYRYLNLLSSAASSFSSDPASQSESYAEVMSFLRENTERVAKIKKEAEAEYASRPRIGPREGHVPIITKVSKEGESPPVYKPTQPFARPLSAIPNGVRKVPRLDVSGYVPFLRLYKPMSAYHERVVRQVSRKRMDRVRLLLEMQSDDLDIARQEDRWEAELARLAKREKKYAEFLGQEKNGVGEELSHEVTMKHAIESLGILLEEQRVDLIARGDALWEIERREQEMFNREQEEERRKKFKDSGGVKTEEVEQFRRWKAQKEKRGRKILKVVGEREEMLRREVERVEMEEELALESKGVVVEKD